MYTGDIFQSVTAEYVLKARLGNGTPCVVHLGRIDVVWAAVPALLSRLQQLLLRHIWPVQFILGLDRTFFLHF
jgi:hypothetical protein